MPTAIARITILIIGFLLLSPVNAQEISLQLDGKRSAVAKFTAADKSDHAVLLLHGFLQTHQFSTIDFLHNELAANGYSVLAPTLTLGINRRNAPLTCEALQNHSMAGGAEEIAAWLQWLQRRGYKHVAVVGHSSGSVRLLDYIHDAGGNTIELFIATSISPLAQRLSEAELQRLRKQATAESGKKMVGRYTLSFCRGNYASPPEIYLSYIAWDDEKILNTLERISVPTHVILGGNDDWLPENWQQRLTRQNISVETVEGATHFFNGAHEFEFQDRILNTLGEWRQP